MAEKRTYQLDSKFPKLAETLLAPNNRKKLAAICVAEGDLDGMRDAVLALGEKVFIAHPDVMPHNCFEQAWKFLQEAFNHEDMWTKIEEILDAEDLAEEDDS